MPPLPTQAAGRSALVLRIQALRTGERIKLRPDESRKFLIAEYHLGLFSR